MSMRRRFGQPLATPQASRSAIFGIREFDSGLVLVLRRACKLQMHLPEGFPPASLHELSPKPL